MLSPVRFRAASQNVERGAEIGSACTIVELPRNFFSPIFPPDPTSEICKIWKHYDYPRFLDPLLPMLQWGICQGDKSSKFWILKIFSVLFGPIIYFWRIPSESPRMERIKSPLLSPFRWERKSS